MEITNDAFNSISIYFNTLAQFGYKKQGDVNKLLVYSFIEEMLTGEMRFFITEADYRLIEQALSCVYGSSCLIPYPQYANDNSLFEGVKGVIVKPRITEDNNIRFTEDGKVRVKSSNYDR